MKRTAATLAVLAVVGLFGWLVPAAAAAEGSAQPLTASWVVTSFRGTHTTVDVPLAPGSTCTPGTTLPTGLTSGHRAATVQIASCAPATRSGPATARLHVRGIAGVGTYHGSIDLLPDDPDHGALTLTIRRTDIVVFPILALLVGIGLAITVGRLTGRGNPISVAEQQSYQLEAKLPQVSRDFVHDAGPNQWADLSFVDSAVAELKGLRSQLATLRRGFTALDKADPTLKSINDELDQMAAAIAAWPALPADLLELSRAAEELRKVAPGFHPPGASPAPTLLAVATTLLTGGAIPVSAVAKRCSDVRSTALALRNMTRDAHTFIGLRTRADAILVAVGKDPMQLERRNYAMWALRGIETDLRAMWTIGTAEAYLALPLQNDVNTIAGTLDSLAPPPQPGFAPDFRPLPPAEVEAPEEAAPSPTTPAPAERARLVGRLRLVDNLLVVVVLAIVTLWSGLVALYFGRAWGSLVDYGTALVWGFGAQAALQAIASGLDVVVRRVQPPAPKP